MKSEEKNKPQNSLLIDKAERLTEAFYRVTDLFPDEEPIKWTLRKKAVEILEKSLRLEREPFHSQAEDLKALSGLIPDIINLLKLSCSGTFISRVNFEVLAREYTNLLGFLDSNQGQGTLEIQEIILLEKRPATEKIIEVADRMADRNKMADKMADRMADRTKTVEITDFFQKGDNQWLNIAELKKALEDKNKKVSVRTLRRNLEKLIKKGAIIQQGENRWRKYALKPENSLN